MDRRTVEIHRKNILGTACFVKKFGKMPDIMVIPQIRELFQTYYDGIISLNELEAFMDDVERLFSLLCHLGRTALKKRNGSESAGMLERINAAEKAYGKEREFLAGKDYWRSVQAQETLARSFEEICFITADCAGTMNIKTHRQRGNAFENVIGAVYFRAGYGSDMPADM